MHIRTALLLGLLATLLLVASCKPVEKQGLPPPGPQAVEVHIKTDPPGATLFVDGVMVGKGPQKVGLNPGNHRIRALKSGYFTAEELLTLSSGTKNQGLTIKLMASH